MKPCLSAGGELESVLWERPINLAPKADFNHGFIGLFHWGMGFCSNGAKLELESRAAYPPTLSEQKPEIPFEPYINMVR